MLLLVRRVDQSVVIRVPASTPGEAPTEITVSVTLIEGNRRVRLGFDAPPHVQVDRGEVREAKDREITVAEVNAARATPPSSAEVMRRLRQGKDKGCENR